MANKIYPVDERAEKESDEEMEEMEIEDRSGEPEVYEDWDYPASDEKKEYYKRGGR
jgi:hypothetical protein